MHKDEDEEGNAFGIIDNSMAMKKKHNNKAYKHSSDVAKHHFRGKCVFRESESN